jgi:hypothetical protein
MTAMHAEETYQGTLGDDRVRAMDPNVRVAAAHNCAASDPRREEFAVAVINALLDAYPKAIRVDSEGGRLVLHTACAGRATPRVISTLLTAYPAACRHRNKDGFLPLHLAAHWGVSHASVAVLLLKSYPDATLGRNRWERTPLEEALCMAGENGRPHQAALVRALRRHPSYWTRPVSEFDLIEQIRSGPIDMDQSLPSNDSTDDNRGKAFGQAIMLDVVEYVMRVVALLLLSRFFLHMNGSDLSISLCCTEWKPNFWPIARIWNKRHQRLLLLLVVFCVCCIQSGGRLMNPTTICCTWK